MMIWSSRYLLPPVLAIASLSAHVWAQSYTVTDLGSGVANDINLRGAVVGNATDGGWYYDGALRTALQIRGNYLGAPEEAAFPAVVNSATAISDGGRIVGQLHPAGTPAFIVAPFFYDGSGVGMAVGQGTSAYGVNAEGTVVGTGFFLVGTNLLVPNGANPNLRSVNAGGIAVGSVAPDGIELAARFVGTNVFVLDLGGLSLPPLGRGASYGSTAFSLNASGETVGQVTLVSGSPLPKPSWAFVYYNGVANDLGNLGGIRAAARDINDSGLAVGSSTLADETSHAFMYEAGKMLDLNALISSGTGWILTAANAVNNAGQIVGEGLLDGVQHAFLLTPVPTGPLPPSITVPPVGQTVALGDTIALTVGASGAPPLSYQWQHAGTNLAGANLASLTIREATAFDGGSYLVIVSNSVASVTSLAVEVVVLDPQLSASLYVGVNIKGAVGARYRLEFKASANPGPWTELATVTLTNTTQIYLDTDSPSYPQRIYQAVRLP